MFFPNIQAAIKALDSYHINSSLGWDCHQSQVKLAGHNRIKLLWVPGHMGTDGNEITDQSDKDGSSLPLRGPELALGISDICQCCHGGDQGLDEQKTQGAVAVHVWTQAG